MNKFFNRILLASCFSLLSMSMLTVSCSDNGDDNFTAGPEPTCGAKTAYFASNYEATRVYGHQPLNVTGEDKDSIAVIRSDKSGALSLPIIFEGDTAVHVSATAEFKDGKDTTYIYVTAPYVKFTEEAKYTLSIPDEYSNPYTVKDGTCILTSGVLWSSWDVVADTCLFYTSANEFPKFGCKVENLRGQNRFRFSNFLDSGNPLEFTIKTDNDFDSSNMHNNAGEIIPLTNYQYGTNGWWYFTNPNGNSWYNYMTPGGGNTIEYISFWPGRTYTAIDLQITKSDTLKIKGKKYLTDYDNHYGIMCSWIDYLDENISNNYCYFYLQLGYLIKDDE